MNRCQDAESKAGGRMKGVPYSERVTVNPLAGSPVNSTRIEDSRKWYVIMVTRALP